MSQSKNPNPNPNPKWGPGKPHRRAITLTVSQGQVAFRLLCSINAGSGVIGHSGSIVKRLVRETSTRIHVADPVSSTCTERVIHVIGSVSVDRRIRFDGEGGNVDVSVSAAQEGLVRVFERVLEVEPVAEGGGDVVKCRLLVGDGLVGAVIGEGGRRINRVEKETGAFIKIFPAESLPPCARLSDELVQISGGTLAVKKALVAVSHYLQQKASQNVIRANGVISTEVLHPSMDVETKDVGTTGTVNEGVATEVVFRLLCPCDVAGAVIGSNGTKIKALEEETGASIRFSSPEDGCNERVITVSAFENRKSKYSSAQNAVFRVFNEAISSGGRRAVIARLLVQPNQVGWFNIGRPSNISAIQEATGANLQILEHNCPLGASTNERIVQIDGEYSSVLTALSRVSWRLREHTFDSMVARDGGLLLPHNLLSLHPSVEETATLTNRINKCRVSEEVNGSQPQEFPISQFSNGHSLRTRMDSPKDLTTPTGDFKHSSGNKPVIVTNTTVEIAVCEGMFGSIYGDDGSNLARLRRISGATVTVQDPCPGSDGKVIISGTPDQTLAAQGLLQAFIMASQ